MFNFKKDESLEMYHELSSDCDDILNLCSSNIPVERKSKLFLKELNSLFHQSFEKIRIRNNKTRRNESEELMQIISKLKMHLRNCQNKDMKYFVKRKIEYAESIISLRLF